MIAIANMRLIMAKMPPMIAKIERTSWMTTQNQNSPPNHKLPPDPQAGMSQNRPTEPEIMHRTPPTTGIFLFLMGSWGCI